MDLLETPSRRRNTGEIVVGVIIVGMGLLLLGDRYLDRDLPLMRSWWPLILIVMGAARLANGDSGPDGRPRSRRSGVWLILVGVWALVSDAHLFGLTFGTSWPLLIIVAGVMMVWRAVETASRPPLGREP
jgi:Domain of unknown function (DUF5668)